MIKERLYLTEAEEMTWRQCRNARKAIFQELDVLTCNEFDDRNVYSQAVVLVDLEGDEDLEPTINVTEEELLFWKKRLSEDVLEHVVENSHFLYFGAAMDVLSPSDRQALYRLVQERLYLYRVDDEMMPNELILYEHPLRERILREAQALCGMMQ